MTGLEKITAQIQLDADATARGIKEKSDALCKELLLNAETQAEAILNKGKEDARKAYSDIIERAESAANLEERKIMLSAKQEVINDMISDAISTLINLPEDKYFELIYKLIEKYSEKAEGSLKFNSVDLKRLPADFVEKSNAVSKGKLTLSESAVQIDGGFILTYGGVDVNCSISSLINDNYEKISDLVAKLLFG